MHYSLKIQSDSTGYQRSDQHPLGIIELDHWGRHPSPVYNPQVGSRLAHNLYAGAQSEDTAGGEAFQKRVRKGGLLHFVLEG